MDDDSTDAAWAHQQELEHRSFKEGYHLDMSKFAGSESKYLKAADLQGKTVKVKVSGVSILEFEDDDGKKSSKPALSLQGKEKQVVCNATSIGDLIQAFGPDSERWVGKEIRLSTKHYPKFGRDGIVITPIDDIAAPNDDIPFAFAFLAPLAAVVVGVLTFGGSLVA